MYDFMESGCIHFKFPIVCVLDYFYAFDICIIPIIVVMLIGGVCSVLSASLHGQ